MKRSKQLFVTTVTILLMTACVSTAKVVEYDYPSDMNETIRVEFKKTLDKGKILYDINCAACHNSKKGKTQIIPDFTKEALNGYAMRVANAEHEENMPDEKVTEDELNLISTFLLYKKKNSSKK